MTKFFNMLVEFILPALAATSSPYWRPIKYSPFPLQGLAPPGPLCSHRSRPDEE